MEKRSTTRFGGPLGYMIQNYRKIDQKFSKKIFGNPGGLKKHIVGSSKINRSLDDELKNSNPLLYQLRKDQCLMMNQPYDSSLIEKIIHKYNQMINDDKYSFVSSEVDGKTFMRHIFLAPKNLPEFADLLCGEVTDIIKGYYTNGNFSVLHVDCRRHYHVTSDVDPTLELFGLRWHCDRSTTDQLKLFVYLTDVTEEDGPLHTQNIERTKELMRRGFYEPEDYRLPDDVIENPKYVLKFTGPKGTAFFGNTNFLLHKAGNPYPGHYRDVIAFHFEASSKPLQEDWLEHVQPIGVEMQEIKRRSKI